MFTPNAVKPRLERVLAAFAAERVGVQHFASVSGYGHGDLGRETLDRVFARVLQAEAAAVRVQFVSGTHAIAAALFGVLRPGDRLLSLTNARCPIRQSCRLLAVVACSSTSAAPLSTDCLLSLATTVLSVWLSCCLLL